MQPERGKDCMNYIKELLFPRRCPVCDGIVKIGEGKICERCETKLIPITEKWCLKCGKPLKQEEREYCRDCVRRNHVFVRGRAVFAYDNRAESVYRFKYRGRQEYAEYYGEMSATVLAEEKEFQCAEALIPVPLHYSRQRKRGYNQAALFARKLGEIWKIPVEEEIVIRKRNTKPLKQLNPLERQNNLKKAFKIVQNDVKLNTIILVDDIYTTGSTIDAVARVFSDIGVRKIYFVTIAVGKGF